MSAAASGRRVLLLRHGQTSWNAVQRGQGHADIELDETGHGQAAAAAPYLAEYQPTMLWSSDLARCRQTTQYVAKETGLEPVYDERLREYDLGERTGLTLTEFEERYPAEFAEFAAGGWQAVPGGETVAEVRARTEAALTDVLAVLPDGESAVMVSHGGSLKCAIAAGLGWTDEQALSLAGLANCGWVVLKQAALGDPFRLAAYNLTAAR
ncbi:histidine phosphatase family protein [Nocardioides speluncae]|uniref:histidine phosphatase family protein n=1 Tax=Nocardioides speluncae TaxID=2670337 RepID=UPI000D695509|nr:histidine phosphatase family protein [Nocardioides speluncae]